MINADDNKGRKGEVFDDLWTAKLLIKKYSNLYKINLI
jgi:hypothetical protein